jgi:4-amino-4-deoxy-L-arabinose transferase-like glycosyltransferase
VKPVNLCFVLLLLASTLAGAEMRVQVLEGDPGSPATLGHWEIFYLRIAYETDRPVRIRADAYSGAKRITEMTGGSPRYEPGKGEAMFWFAFTRQQKVDRVVVLLAEDRTGKPIAQAEYPVDLTWTGQKAGSERPRAEWVTRLRAEADSRIKAEFKAQTDEPAPWWWVFLFQAIVVSVPVYLVLQGILLWRWQGRWRLLAGMAAIPMALALAHAIFAFFAGSNIFPVILIFTAPIALIYLVVLMIIKRRTAPA